jgi:hypothetical protein
MNKQKEKNNNTKPKLYSKAHEVPVGGLERDGPTEYTHETEFVNIKPKFNIISDTDAPQTYNSVQRGILADGVDITVVKNGGAATLQGMKKRCDDKPQNDRESLAFISGHKALMSKIHVREEIRISEQDVEDYIRTCSRDKAARLQMVWREQDFDTDMYQAKMVFAKTEVLVKEHGASPRVIYQGTDIYNLLFGVQMFILTRRIKEELSSTNPLNTGNTIIYACGMDDGAISTVFDRTKGRALENDLSRNDSTQTTWMRRYEAMFYKKLGATSWWVREFAKTTSVNIWTRFGISAVIEGQRWSGEVPTTPGNGHTNACHILSYLPAVGVTESVSVVYGDDGLTITKQKLVDEAAAVISAVVAGSGMIAKPVLHEDVEKATFLRKRRVLGPNGFKSVPQYGRVLAKINVRGNFNTAIDDRQYMAGKYLSAAYEHRHAPQLSERLVKTSEALSDKPFLDARNQSSDAFGYSAQQLVALTREAVGLPRSHLDAHCIKVYGVHYDDVIREYDIFGSSATAWANSNVTLVKGKPTTVKKPYCPPLRNSVTLAALTDIDC